jgi:predicted RNase H-like HicB family nuclease
MEQRRAFIAVIRMHAPGEFEARFPDLPYCVAFGSTEDEAIWLAAEALADQLDELVENEETIPVPSTLAEIVGDPQWRGCVAVRIEAAPRGDEVPRADEANDACDRDI